MAESMFGDYGSVFDAATADNVSVRDRALSVAQLEPGRATVYGAHQAGGMLMQNLAGMAGMKTARQEKAELITKIMEESQGLDPNSPNSSLILSQKFASAGFPNIAQQFAQKYRDMSVKDREQERLEESAATLKAYYEKTTEIQADRLEFEGEREKTRIAEVAAALEVSLAEATRIINKGEIIEIPVPNNTTGAMMNARLTYDKDGLNPKITPLKSPAVTPTKVETSRMDAPPAAVTDVSTTREIEEIAVSPTDDTSAAVATGGTPSIDTLEGLANSGFMISDFGSGADVRGQQLIDDKKRDIIAAEIERSYEGDIESIEGTKEVRERIRKAISGGEYGVWDGSLTDSTVYARLGNKLNTLETSERADKRLERSEASDTARAVQSKQDDDYKQVIQGADGKDIAAGFILKTGKGTLGDTEADALAGHIGADINAYDMALSGDRELDDDGIAQGVTPQEAYLGGYYERALSFPGVYTKDTKPGILGLGRGDTLYDSLRFKTVLNKTLARGTAVVYPGEIDLFLQFGLIIPNVTPIQGPPDKEHPDGRVGTWTRAEIDKQKQERKIN